MSSRPCREGHSGRKCSHCDSSGCIAVRDELRSPAAYVANAPPQRAIAKKIKLPVRVAGDFCSLLRNNSSMAIPATVADDACRDPKDLYLLGLCKSTRADFLVTGDRDLIESGWRDVTKIVTPRQFWVHCGQR